MLDYHQVVPINRRTPKERALKEADFVAQVARKYTFKNLVLKIINDKRQELKKMPEYLVTRFLDLLRNIPNMLGKKEYVQKVINRRKIMDEIRTEERVEFGEVALQTF